MLGRVFVFAMFVMLFFVVFVLRRMFVLDMHGITQRSGVFGGFVGGVGFEFGAVGGAVLFDFGGFGFGEFRFRGDLILGGIEPGILFGFFLGLLFFR